MDKIRKILNLAVTGSLGIVLCASWGGVMVPEGEAASVPVVASCEGVADAFHYPTAYRISFVFSTGSNALPHSLSFVSIDAINGSVGGETTVLAESQGFDEAEGYAVLKHPTMRHDTSCGHLVDPVATLVGSVTTAQSLKTSYSKTSHGSFQVLEASEQDLPGLTGVGLDAGNMGVTWGNTVTEGSFYVKVKRRIGAVGESSEGSLSFRSIINERG